MLDRQGIPQDLLRKADESPIKFRAAMSKLKSFSFVTEEQHLSRYSMHRLTQLSTRGWIDHLGKRSHYQEIAVAVVGNALPTYAEYELWPIFNDMKPHITSVLEFRLDTTEAQLHRAKVLHSYGHYVLGHSLGRPALPYLREAHTLRHTHLGPEHEDTLTTMGYIGLAHGSSDIHDVSEAQHIHLHVAETAKQILGHNHRLTLKSESRLAITYDKQKRLLKAKELHMDVLKRMEENLGLEDRYTLSQMSHLLYLLNRLRLWNEANEVGQLALRLRSRLLGPSHMDTVTIMAQLAITYNALERWKEAAELEQQVLDLRLEALGPDHLKTLHAMYNVARTSTRQGRNDEAKELLGHVVKVRAQTLGLEHKLTEDATKQLQNIDQPEWRKDLTGTKRRSLRGGRSGGAGRGRGMGHKSRSSGSGSGFRATLRPTVEEERGSQSLSPRLTPEESIGAERQWQSSPPPPYSEEDVSLEAGNGASS